MVKLSCGEHEAVGGVLVGAAYLRDVEGVVVDVGQDVTVVVDDVADRTEMVGQVPDYALSGPVSGYDLVNSVADPKIATNVAENMILRSFHKFRCSVYSISTFNLLGRMNLV